MKPPPFKYVRAENTAAIGATLQAYGDEAQILAGGQSLMPLLAMRLVRPTVLLDINPVEDLDHITETDDAVIIGASARQRAVERAGLVEAHLPLLAKALPHVGHIQTRNRGTVVGSLTHAEPSAEIPLVAVVLGATLVLENPTMRTKVDAADFFIAAMETVLADTAWVSAVHFPRWPTSHAIGSAFMELAPRQGDFAVAAAAAQVAWSPISGCSRIALGLGGASPTPLRFPEIETALTDTHLDDDRIADAVAVVETRLSPSSDIHADADYRRKVAPVLLARAIRAARDDAVRHA